AHIEGLDLRRVTRDDHRLLEVLLHQIALVLALQVHAPFHRELELLLLVGFAAQQDLDRAGVSDALEGIFQHELQASDQAHFTALRLWLLLLLLSQAGIEELQVVHAVLQYAGDEVLAQALGQVHVAVEIHEGGLGLHHPELGQVAGGVAVLRAEGGAEGVYLAQGERGGFRLQLPAYREVAFRAEEVLLEVHLTRLVQRRLFGIKRAYTEHFPRTFRIARENDRAVEVVVAERIEMLVDAEAHLVADAEDRAVGVGAEAQVGMLPQELQAVLFRLDGVLVRWAVAEDLHRCHLHFHALAAALGRDQLAGTPHGSAGGEARARSCVHLLLIDHALQVADGAAIVQRNEAVVAESAHPAGHGNGGAGKGGVVEDLFDGVHAD